MASLADIGDVLQTVVETLRLDRPGVVGNLLQVAVILAVTWIGLLLVRLSARRVLHYTKSDDPSRTTDTEQRGKTLAGLIQSVGRAAIIVVALLLLLNVFLDVTPLLAGAGIAGLALSFGAQSLVKDLIAGFFILLEDQFRVGDIIRAGGVDGVVEDMTLRKVMLRDVHGVLHFVPNGQITVVSNLTRHWARAVLDVGVAYSEDLDRVMAALRRVLQEFAADARWAPELMDQPSVVGVERLGESSVDLRVWANVRPGRQWDVERELRRRIKNRFDEEGIEIPLPQRVVRLVPAGAEMPHA